MNKEKSTMGHSAAAYIKAENEICSPHLDACLREFYDNLDGIGATRFELTFDKKNNKIIVYNNGTTFTNPQLQAFTEDIIMSDSVAADDGLHIHHMGLKKALIGLSKCYEDTGELKIISKKPHVVMVGTVRGSFNENMLKGEPIEVYDDSDTGFTKYLDYKNGVTMEITNCKESAFEPKFIESFKKEISTSYTEFNKRNGIEDVYIDGERLEMKDEFNFAKYAHCEPGCYEEKDFYVRVNLINTNDYTVRILEYLNSRENNDKQIRQGVKALICGALTDSNTKELYGKNINQGGGKGKYCQVIVVDGNEAVKDFPTYSLKALGLNNLKGDQRFKSIKLKDSKKTLYKALLESYELISALNGFDRQVGVSSLEDFKTLMENGKQAISKEEKIRSTKPKEEIEKDLNSAIENFESTFTKSICYKIDKFDLLNESLKHFIMDLSEHIEEDRVAETANIILKTNKKYYEGCM